MPESNNYVEDIRLVDYLTYGRDQEFTVGLFLQTIPLLFALVPGSVPILRLPINSTIAIGILSCILIALLVSLHRTIQWITGSIYSLDLRKTRSQIISMFAYIFVGVIATVVGYLTFITPYEHPEFVFVDALLGAVCALLYAQILAFVLWQKIKPDTTSDSISEEIEEFLECTQQLKNSPGTAPGGTPDKIVTQARNIARNIEKEEASGTRRLDRRLRSWADDFDGETNIQGWKEYLESSEFSKISNDLCGLS